MGLTAYILKSHLGDCSNGGISGSVDQVTVVNVDGPFDPSDSAPAVMLVAGNLPGSAKVVCAELDEATGEYAEWREPGRIGPMMGGCYIETSDSRWHRAVEEVAGSRQSGAVPFHDRFETQAEYDALSR